VIDFPGWEMFGVNRVQAVFKRGRLAAGRPETRR